MNETRTDSILQRVPKILAVTAASYGLTARAQPRRMRPATANAGCGPHRAAAFDRTAREAVVLSY
ncbi:MAG: hypothetical protein H0X13_12065 [Ramlibacter sp.]|nr:hypothetical protein [Gemmatimonadales bacterium]MBA3773188.1 hypothetical protein [Ramlibacter sp.]